MCGVLSRWLWHAKWSCQRGIAKIYEFEGMFGKKLVVPRRNKKDVTFDMGKYLNPIFQSDLTFLLVNY